jgi:transcriptional regulator with XRE-family HTH domain
MEQNSIGQKIRLARVKKGMTQADLAGAMSVSQGAVCQWESGITLPKARSILKLSKLLEIPVDELLKAG